MKKIIWLLVLIIAVAGCASSGPQGDDTSIQDQQEQVVDDSATAAEPEVEDIPDDTGLPLWMTAELKDVLTDTTFTINDFKGTPVVLESFAVWCPTCTRQQEMIRGLHRSVGDSVVSISLDTDPNEDEETVRDHAIRREFDWNYVVSPSEVTQSLVDTFGVGVVNAPSVPVIIVCPDQSYELYSGSVKGPAILKSYIDACEE